MLGVDPSAVTRIWDSGETQLLEFGGLGPILSLDAGKDDL